MMIDLIPLFEPIRQEIVKVDSILCQTLKEVDEPLRTMLQDTLCRGKKLRPALVILVSKMFNQSGRHFYKLAAAVEVLHTATLIHDDLVDNAPLRRGQKTLHTVWPIGSTVLTGDYLFSKSVTLVAELDRPNILKILAEALGTMCVGEIRYLYINKERLNREEYFRSIEAKTASLFAAAAEMAGILASAGKSQIKSLRVFGYELGIAFQIVDDILDFVSDEARLGKPAGSDLSQGIATLPAIIYLEKVKNDPSVNSVLRGHSNAKQIKKAIEAIRSSNAIEASLAEARVHARNGQQALAALPDSGPRQILYSLADYIVKRRY